MSIKQNYMEPREAAQYLAMSLNTLYYHCSQKQIPHFKMKGRLRFKPDELDGWMEQQRVEVV